MKKNIIFVTIFLFSTSLFAAQSISNFELVNQVDKSISFIVVKESNSGVKVDKLKKSPAGLEIGMNFVGTEKIKLDPNQKKSLKINMNNAQGIYVLLSCVTCKSKKAKNSGVEQIYFLPAIHGKDTTFLVKFEYNNDNFQLSPQQGKLVGRISASNQIPGLVNLFGKSDSGFSMRDNITGEHVKQVSSNSLLIVPEKISSD